MQPYDDKDARQRELDAKVGAFWKAHGPKVLAGAGFLLLVGLVRGLRR